MTVLNLIEVKIQNYVESKRPDDPEIRKMIDFGFSYQNNTVEIFEIRPQWNYPTALHKYPFAKARYIISKNIWKVYWMKSNGQWSLYDPAHEVSNIEEFFEVIDKDQIGCFWG